ncbi:hypothetical protein AKJ59_00750 [candidate division MSBL1 archaeon SCGC-AAA385M02]|uniref:Uncharacterized protein n=1 Tax=candidate division MSBL1 archaeon SCGC-AAA385M02 TaxID=1698287 RepID=A0A133VQ62_9EURY|nr:hypothetical protein AKJ59_00750 [candidate division MSBL1 archaeon SCGC-AAA385M02]
MRNITIKIWNLVSQMFDDLIGRAEKTDNDELEKRAYELRDRIDKLRREYEMVNNLIKKNENKAIAEEE